jgi:DNA-binding LacI/PurR family transcriptional regulator
LESVESIVSDPKPAPNLIRSTADFARYVGLSRSAVSRVLNERPGLRPATVELVRRAMQETGFTPNAHAVHLRGKPTGMIGVCVENFVTPTGVTKLSLLQQRLRECGYVAMIQVQRPGASAELVRHFLSLRVEAIIFIGHFNSTELADRVADLRRHHVPHVVIDHSGCDTAPTVTLDRPAAMELVVAHLHALGHRRYGLIGISGPYQTVTDRLDGLRAALAKRRLDFGASVESLDALHIRRDHFEYGRTLAREFARRRPRPTAFIAVNDETAVGALLEFQSLRLRIPADLSIVGFNNQNICQMTRPQLTSVDQQIERTVALAVQVVSGQLRRAKPAPARVRLIAPELVVRDSTGPAPRH